MEAKQIRQLGPRLRRFLARFDNCFHRSDTRSHLATYCRGLLLAYAADELHCLLDSDLYLPQSWDQDRKRCREAGIPDTVEYRPKWQIGLELWERAQANGVRFSGLTRDEGDGGVPELLRRLHRGGQRFVAEVPTTFRRAAAQDFPENPVRHSLPHDNAR